VTVIMRLSGGVAAFKLLSPGFKQEFEIKISAAYDLCVKQFITFTF